MNFVGRIGKYATVRVLGAGSFATVWLAVDEVLEAEVAIKVLAENWSQHPDVRRRFVDEARLLRRIDHDRVVRVHEINELPDGRPYFVMTLADRGTLQDRIDQHGPLDPAEAVRIGAELCECLAVVHDIGTVHRDVKPSNVLFRSVRPHERAAAARRGNALGDETILLGDFGLAKDLVLASGFTQAAGTPAYMAPEQAGSASIVDHRADVFAVGATLFEALTGRPPSAASTVSGVRRTGGATGGLTPIRLVQPTTPTELADIVDRALAIDPARRYDTVTAMADALGALTLMPAGFRPGVGSAQAGSLSSEVWSPPARALAPLTMRERVEQLVTPHLRDADRAPFAAALQGAPTVCLLGVPDDNQYALRAIAGLHWTHGTDPHAVDRSSAVIFGTPRFEAAYRAALPQLAVVPVATFSLPDERDRSMFDHLHAALANLAARTDAVVVATAIAQLDPLAQSAALSAAIERVRSEFPDVTDIEALRTDQRVPVSLAPALRSEAVRLLFWLDPAQRLGVPAGSVEQLRPAIAAAIERWRTLDNSGRIPFAARAFTATLQHCLDRLWLTIT